MSINRPALCIAAMLLCAVPPLFGQPVSSDSDAYFDTEGVRNPILISEYRLAILLRPGAAIGRLDAILKKFKLRVEEEFPGNLVLLAADAPRGQLIHVAREIKASNELVIAAGLAVKMPGSRAPAILGDELIVQLSDNLRERAGAEFSAQRLKVLTQNAFVRGQYLVRIADDPPFDALEAANKLRRKPGVLYAFPNFYSVAENFETIPTDPMFASEWHHRNSGASGGTATADSRTTLAWDFTQGASSTVLALNELFGFDIAHEDLAANLWINAGEIAGNGIDDDGNGFVDDVHGWNFTACAVTMTAGCGSATLTPASDTSNDAHATQVAGVAVAAANNSLGVVGGCPSCQFMPLVSGIANSDFQKALAFGYARTKAATIVSNSWGGGGPYPATTAAINMAATAGRGGLGIPIFFAAGNTGVDVCTGINQAPLASLPNVIAVSSSSNLDRWVTSHGFGNCISILAPTRWGAAETIPSGTLGITTTDRTGAAGENSNNPDCLGGLTNPSNLNYTNCFSGTSSATPLAASIAGLVLTLNPSLTAAQVRNLLQDTADKVEDSTGTYAEASGYSSPTATSATHAFGRINAFEAVRIAAPAAKNGKAGVDVFVRDNRLDWGNTDHPSNTLLEPTRGFIPHWQSVDIKVDAPPYQTPPTNNAQFEMLTDENAQSGVLNRVYVRVRNRGPAAASSVTIKAHYAFAGAGLPNLPADFWATFPADSASTGIWHPLGIQTVTNLAYSGASVADSAADAAQIVEFDFNGPPIDATQSDPHHFCIFVVLDSPQDRAGPLTRTPTANDFIPDDITPTDNNVTHRNIVVEGVGGTADFSDRFFVNNPFDREARARLIALPGSAQVKFEPLGSEGLLTLKPHERRLVNLRMDRPKEGYAEVTLVQITRSGEKTVYGGMTYRFGKSPEVKVGTQRFTRPANVTVIPVKNEAR